MTQDNSAAMNAPSTQLFGTFLFSRIKQLGISNIFGVPGDFNLQLLDFVYKVPGLNWVGCCNELNAAYAADGYGRLRGPVEDGANPSPRIPGALITTYGVGELSALNGISGAHAETVPILHIVGMTGRAIQEKHLWIHHVSPPARADESADHLVYMQTSKPFSCATELINDPKTAPEQIDRVIREICRTSRPGYLYIPIDMAFRQVEVTAPLDLSNLMVNANKADEDAVVAETLAAIYAAKSPTIVADVIADRFNCREAIKRLVDLTKFWSFTTPMGKGLVDETDNAFVGVYNGEFSRDGVAQAVHSSDCVLNIGPLLSDSNTGGFSRQISEENLVLLHPQYCIVKGKKYNNVHFGPVLVRVLEELEKNTDKIPSAGPKPTVGQVENPDSTQITQTSLVQTLSEYFKPNDTVVVESGTFQFAVPDCEFKSNTSFFTQIYYSSIGFALPAALGAAVAKKETTGYGSVDTGRLILVEGDGSAQMTIQELGTMIRQEVPVTVFLLNNDGYSIERAIWGPKQEYNDICPYWKWTELLSTFGGTNGKTVANYKVSSRKEFDELISNKEFTDNTTKVQLVEVILDAFDYPWILKEQIKRMGGYNMTQAKLFAESRGEL